MRILALLFVIACNAPAPATPDAAPRPIDAADDAAPDAAPDGPPGPDLSCLGQPTPATAQDPLSVIGTLFSVENYQIAAVTGAAVVLHRRSDDSIIAQATTAADGTFAMSVASGGVAVDGYFTVAVASYRPSRIDPGAPLSGGENALMLIANDAELARWYAVAGVAYSATSSTLVTAAVDCNHATLGGTTLSVTPATSVTYYNQATQRWDAALAASTNGFSLVANAASESSVIVHAASDLPAHAFVAPSGTLSIAVVQPYQ